MCHRAWAATAAAQAGVITTAQVRAAGIDHSRRTRMVAEGLLARYRDGLYLVRAPRSTPATHSHSMVPGGLLVTSRTTRFTPSTSLVTRVEIRASRSCGRRDQSAVIASSLLTGRSTIG